MIFCKLEPVFVDLLRRPRIDFQPGGPVRQPYLSFRFALSYIGYSWIDSSDSISGLHIRLKIRALSTWQRVLEIICRLTSRNTSEWTASVSVSFPHPMAVAVLPVKSSPLLGKHAGPMCYSAKIVIKNAYHKIIMFFLTTFVGHLLKGQGPEISDFRFFVYHFLPCPWLSCLCHFDFFLEKFAKIFGTQVGELKKCYLPRFFLEYFRYFWQKLTFINWFFTNVWYWCHCHILFSSCSLSSIKGRFIFFYTYRYTVQYIWHYIPW